jgi:peptide/nickel transport system substrate-binding protein
LLIAGCAQPVELDLPITVGPTPRPTDTTVPPTLEPPPSTLIVCLGQEPESLYRYGPEYLYGDTGRAAETVLQAIYDGPLDLRGYEYAPVILEKLPNLGDADAELLQVEVVEGERYFDPETLLPATLERGDRYLPSGCQAGDCIRTYAGGPVTMDQMQVDFQLRSDVAWSDGQPVTAQDSVFSFEVDQDPETPTPKTLVDRTASYQALDDRTTRWTGIPGYNDSEYFANFWSPLPAHQLGQLSPAEMLTADATTRSPIGWGPYIAEEWRTGNDILLRRNPDYFRAAEGLPAFDLLLFRFLNGSSLGSIEQLLTSECDVLDESAISDALNIEAIDSQALATLLDLRTAGRLQLATGPGAEMERLEFGLAPVPGTGRPLLFGDPRTRAGIAACINRERILLEVLLGLSEGPHSYLPPSHPLATEGALTPRYDPTAALELLAEAGWTDDDGDPETPLRASAVENVANGTELAFSFVTTPDGYHQELAEHIRSDLEGCGIQVEIDFLPQDELFEPWPDGLAFGRQFQAVGWAWPSWVSPLCEMFASQEIPSDNHPFGINASGYLNRDYDDACTQLLYGLPDSAAYSAAARTTQELFTESLPAIPLFMRPRVIAYSTEVCGFEIEPAAFSSLWNLEQIRFGTACAGS